ncbi:Wyosine [tRNA(Phe)-imidazoG37] synthetase, radical SAM superfamily [Tangfeifania diversioriginum]|uniref:Wyosine [tRNA(Phe)-imidazoG37] synthetase, radical SAM superfamily n=1 Tax=Tangfeifania diversioriginum TaxID=1168035 RepID=A0A1M6MU54_9BACT|nr:radical SAM protein [Tangfeifania diversioriginum]SHJ86942.1 Wyosine [tRNA(Phe)-imidazoG37] synthetase, radical SAM superfamily [Tangfeifania diversioriginum]
MERRVFGPVPSRRLGKSLGVNNIPYKICTYSCIYCQVGKAIKMQINRQEFYKPDDLAGEVKELLNHIQNEKDYPDYITIVPDGEPTLDINLGVLIEKLKMLGVPLAVITNASLIDQPEVQNELLKADFVSFKADSFSPETWKKINIPHKQLDLQRIKEGIRVFRNYFSGKMVTETMLVKGVNDSPEELKNTARVIQGFKPDVAYIAIPTRPPAFKKVEPSDEGTVNTAYHIFKEYIKNVELLTGYEGNAFASAGNFRDDLLSITAVHPMREDAVLELLDKTDGNKNSLEVLLQENLVEKVQYSGHSYYLRKFTR